MDDHPCSLPLAKLRMGGASALYQSSLVWLRIWGWQSPGWRRVSCGIEAMPWLATMNPPKCAYISRRLRHGAPRLPHGERRQAIPAMAGHDPLQCLYRMFWWEGSAMDSKR